MLALSRKIKKLYGPYFGFSGQKLRHTLSLAAMFAFNLLILFSLALMETTLNSLIGALAVSSLTYGTLFLFALNYVAIIGLFTLTSTINFMLARWLGHSVGLQKARDLAGRWFQGPTAFLMRLVSKKSASPSQLIGKEAIETAEYSFLSLASFMMTFDLAIVGFYTLWILSGVLAVPLFGQTLLIPGYLALGSLVYSLLYNWITSAISKKIKKQEAENKEKTDAVVNQLEHTQVGAEQIVMRQGQKFEQERLEVLVVDREKKFKQHFKWSTGLDFIRTVHQRLSVGFGILMVAPRLISGALQFGHILQVANSFGNVVGVFTWQRDNYEWVHHIETSADRLIEFEKSLGDTEKLEEQPAANVFYELSEKSILFNQVAVKTPTNETKLTLDRLVLPANARIKIVGETGLGKTTLLRMISQIWPFGEGDIHLPVAKEDILCLTQETYFPANSTLWEAIIFPKKTEQVQVTPDQVRAWMRTMHFSEANIEGLMTDKSDWEELSGGEKQRVALLSVLVHRPKLALMDEPIASINKEVVQECLALLKQELSDTDFACIDHTATKDFYTHELRLYADKAPELIPLNHEAPRLLQKVA